MSYDRTQYFYGVEPGSLKEQLNRQDRIARIREGD